MKNISLPSRVLLIAPCFFGYENEIAGELMRSGSHVDLLPDRPFVSPLMKSIMRFRPELGGNYLCDQFFAKRIGEFGRSDYTTILVIQGEGVTANTLMILRKAYPRAKLVFYAWDSIENKPFSRRNLFFYDYCSTFDPIDAKKYGMFFRPLFYADRFDYPADIDYSYDLSFVGTIHSDRYKLVKAIFEQLPPETRTFLYLYLQASWMFDLRRLFTKGLDGAKRKEFNFHPLAKEVIQDVFFKSRAVLDIEHPNQHGATMRTIEAIGSERKIVSTNTALRDYDFYNPLNIQIIDRKTPKLSIEFLHTPYQVLPQEVRRKYSISQWVSEVCDFDKKEAIF